MTAPTKSVAEQWRALSSAALRVVDGEVVQISMLCSIAIGVLGQLVRGRAPSADLRYVIREVDILIKERLPGAQAATGGAELELLATMMRLVGEEDGPT